MARRSKGTKLPAPYLRRITLRADAAWDAELYPFSLPWLDDEFEFTFEEPVTIFCGENGTGKSTLIETLATLAGFPVSGGGAWAGTHQADPDEESPRALAAALRAGWLPKVSRGWFLRAGSFEAVAGQMATDHLSVSHGEGFMGVIADRMGEQGLFIFDEPEAALSPRHQAKLMAFLTEIQRAADAQVVMATHSPILMAVPGAALWHLSHRGLLQVALHETEHFKLWQSFATDPDGFVDAALAGQIDTLT